MNYVLYCVVNYNRRGVLMNGEMNGDWRLETGGCGENLQYREPASPTGMHEDYNLVAKAATNYSLCHSTPG